MNWITKNIFEAIADAMAALLDMYGSLIANIFDTIADVNVNSSIITNCSNFLTLFSLALLGLLAGKQILDVYVFQTSGDADAEPLQIVVRIAQACAVICSGTWIFNEFLIFSRYFTSDLLASANETEDVSGHMGSLLQEAVQTMDTAQSQSIGMIFTLFIILIGFIIFCVVAGVRGAELTLMKLLLPLFAVDLLTTNRERWNNFFTTYMITFFSYSLQLICFKMCSMTFMAINYDGDYSIRFVTVLGWLILMIRAPRWLEKFAYSSGIGNAAASTMRFAPMYLLKMKG